MPPDSVAIALPGTGTDLTEAIRAAIAAAHAQGGGVVTVPPGDWTSGGLRLLDGVRLHSVGRRPAGGGAGLGPLRRHRGRQHRRGLRPRLHHRRGRPRHRHHRFRPAGRRQPALARRRRRQPGHASAGRPPAAHGGVRGLRAGRDRRYRHRGSPMWTIHLVGCRRAVVRNVEIRNDKRMPSTDGINLDGCCDAGSKAASSAPRMTASA